MLKEYTEGKNVLVHNPVVDVLHMASQRFHSIELIFFFALVSGSGTNEVAKFLSLPALFRSEDRLIHCPGILGVLASN